MDKSTILIVDDNPMVIDVIRRMIRLDGRFDPLEADNGISALDAIETARPVCIVIDAMMPGLDGFQLLRALRGDANTAQIALVMLTALVKPENEQHGILSGADVYLTKPFKLEDLMRAITTAMQITPEQRYQRLLMLEASLHAHEG